MEAVQSDEWDGLRGMEVRIGRKMRKVGKEGGQGTSAG